MGHAVYKVPGVVHGGPLDDFWSKPQAPDRELYECFRQVLADRCLIRGGLLSEVGLRMLIDNALPRLTADKGGASGSGEGGPLSQKAWKVVAAAE